MGTTKLEKMTRPPLERIIRIFEAIGSGSFPNCRTMGEENSVHEDTIWEDIEFMRDRWQMPIEYNRKKHGYYFDGPVPDFLRLVSISEEELFAVAIVERTVTQYEGTPLAQPLRMLFDKIKNFLSPSKKYAIKNLHKSVLCRTSVIEDSNYDTFKILSDAIESQRVVQLMYRKHNSQDIAGRTLHPYALISVDSRWYLVALDPAKKNVQTYVLRRMSDIKTTKEQYAVREDFNLDAFLEKCFRIMGGTGDYEVVVEFDSWGTDIICDRIWHPTQKFEMLPNGGSRITMQLSSLEEIEGWVLSHGVHATAIQPQELCDRIEKTTGELHERYKKRREERGTMAVGLSQPNPTGSLASASLAASASVSVPPRIS